MTIQEAKESILESQVNAALAGHDLGPFEPVEVLTWGGEYCQDGNGCQGRSAEGDSIKESDSQTSVSG